MAKRDFEKKYEIIEEQHFRLIEILRKKQEEMTDELVDPDYIEKLNEVTLPIASSYGSVSYMRFLLKKDKALFDREYEQIRRTTEKLYFGTILLAKEVVDGDATKEMLENMKKVAHKSLDNYNIWNYFFLLLNRPVKKRSAKKYDAQVKDGKVYKGVLPITESLESFDKIVATNESVLKDVVENY